MSLPHLAEFYNSVSIKKNSRRLWGLTTWRMWLSSILQDISTCSPGSSTSRQGKTVASGGMMLSWPLRSQSQMSPDLRVKGLRKWSRMPGRKFKNKNVHRALCTSRPTSTKQAVKKLCDIDLGQGQHPNRSWWREGVCLASPWLLYFGCCQQDWGDINLPNSKYKLFTILEMFECYF